MAGAKAAQAALAAIWSQVSDEVVDEVKIVKDPALVQADGLNELVARA